MRIQLVPLLFVIPLYVACADSVPENLGVVQQDLTYRYCASESDCANPGCDCVGNQCVPDGFGPPHPDCGRRFCSDQYDCATGCDCVGYFCAPDGFGPPNPDCSDPNQPSQEPPSACDSCPSGQSCHCGEFCSPNWYYCP